MSQMRGLPGKIHSCDSSSTDRLAPATARKVELARAKAAKEKMKNPGVRRSSRSANQAQPADAADAEEFQEDAEMQDDEEMVTEVVGADAAAVQEEETEGEAEGMEEDDTEGLETPAGLRKIKYNLMNLVLNERHKNLSSDDTDPETGRNNFKGSDIDDTIILGEEGQGKGIQQSEEPQRQQQNVMQFSAGAKGSGSGSLGAEGTGPESIPPQWERIDGAHYFLATTDWGKYFGKDRERVTVAEWYSRSQRNERFVRMRAGFPELVLQLGEMDKADFDGMGLRKNLMELYNLDYIGSLPPRDGDPHHRMIMARWPEARHMTSQDAILKLEEVARGSFMSERKVARGNPTALAQMCNIMHLPDADSNGRVTRFPVRLVLPAQARTEFNPDKDFCIDKIIVYEGYKGKVAISDRLGEIILSRKKMKANPPLYDDKMMRTKDKGAEKEDIWEVLQGKGYNGVEVKDNFRLGASKGKSHNSIKYMFNNTTGTVPEAYLQAIKNEHMLMARSMDPADGETITVHMFDADRHSFVDKQHSKLNKVSQYNSMIGMMTLKSPEPNVWKVGIYFYSEQHFTADDVADAFIKKYGANPLVTAGALKRDNRVKNRKLSIYKVSQTYNRVRGLSRDEHKVINGITPNTTYGIKVLPGGDVMHRMRDEMLADEGWRMPIQFAIKMSAEEERKAGRDEAAPAYRVGNMALCPEDFIMPEDYPPPPEPTTQDLVRFARNTYAPVREREEIEWKVRQIADPIWNEWQMVRGRWRPKDAVSAAVESDARRNDEAVTQLQMELNSNLAKIIKEEADTLKPVQKVISAAATKLQLETMTEVRHNNTNISIMVTGSPMRAIRKANMKESISKLPNVITYLEGIQPNKKGKDHGGSRGRESARSSGSDQAGHHRPAAISGQRWGGRRSGGGILIYPRWEYEGTRGNGEAHGEKDRHEEDDQARRKAGDVSESGEDTYKDKDGIRRSKGIQGEAANWLQAKEGCWRGGGRRPPNHHGKGPGEEEANCGGVQDWVPIKKDAGLSGRGNTSGIRVIGDEEAMEGMGVMGIKEGKKAIEYIRVGGGRKAGGKKNSELETENILTGKKSDPKRVRNIKVLNRIEWGKDKKSKIICRRIHKGWRELDKKP